MKFAFAAAVFLYSWTSVFAQPGAATPALSTTPAQDAASKETPKEAPKRAPCAIQTPKDGWNSAAQFIAGMNGGNFTATMSGEQRGAWSYYSRAVESDWKRVKDQYLDRIDTWRKTNLSYVPAGGTAFYPFSGPDAANVLTFFPDAKDYVMIGLEPAGCLPIKVPDYPVEYWSNLRRSLQSVVAMGFFKTEDMRKDFSEGVDGFLPALLFLVARSGFTVVDVEATGINKDGVLGPVGTGPARSETRGVTIRFDDGKHGVRSLTYFSLNLQDSAIKRKPGTIKYLESLPAPSTLIKSASYLMHKKYFSTVRDVILAHSAVVVEDDSGIPFHFFDKAWDVRLYGHYSKPIEMFATWTQPDLKTAFQTSSFPLEFGIGYKYKPSTSTLILARRKT